MNLPAGTDPIADAAAAAVQGVHELRADNARLTEMAAQYEKSYCIAQAELEMTKAALKTMTAAHDRVQRFNVELVTQLNNVHMILDGCFERAKVAQYLPDTTPPPEQITSDTAEPIPEFLQQGPAMGGNGRNG